MSGSEEGTEAIASGSCLSDQQGQFGPKKDPFLE